MDSIFESEFVFHVDKYITALCMYKIDCILIIIYGLLKGDNTERALPHNYIECYNTLTAMTIILKIKKTGDTSFPTQAYKGDAALDLYVAEEVVLKPRERCGIRTGISVAIPEGYAGLIWDKSGLSIKCGLKTLGGVIDAGYRGEVIVGIVNLSDEEHTFHVGDKIAQMLIQKVEDVEIKEVTTLEESERGERGFGSSGK